MSTSFIVFIVLAVLIVAVASFRMGMKVSKSTKLESPDAQNARPYEECLAQNEHYFEYGTFTDPRDGETYRTIEIGKQVWMAENLRFKTEGSFAPDNDEKNVARYGRLYTWTAAMGIPAVFSDQQVDKDIDIKNKMQGKNFRGIAPEGWHIPSDKEWEELANFVAKKAKDAHVKLRSSCIWQKPGRDTYGFFALPAGYRFDSGCFCQFGKRTRFWSKNEYGSSNAYRFGLTEESADIEGVYRSDAISVRCIKNT